MKTDTEACTRLREIREGFGLTQKDLSDKIGYNQSYYSQIERGEKGITSKLTTKLFVLFGVSSDWLLNGIGNKPDFKKDTNVGGILAGQEKEDGVIPSNSLSQLIDVQNIKNNDPLFFEWLHKKYLNEGLSKYFESKKDEIEFYYHACLDLMEVIPNIHKIPYNSIEFEEGDKLFPENERSTFIDGNVVEYYETLSTTQKIEYTEQLEKRLSYIKGKFKNLLRFLFLRTLYPNRYKDEDIHKESL